VRLTDTDLAKVGVEIVNRNETQLRCKHCGTEWSPNAGEGGRLPPGWWKCPNGPHAELSEDELAELQEEARLQARAEARLLAREEARARESSGAGYEKAFEEWYAKFYEEQYEDTLAELTEKAIVAKAR
jgi:hypothetical protein